MRISELSDLLGIPKSTLRLYEQKGVFSGRTEEKSNCKEYNVWDILFLLEFIKLRRIGFSIDEAVKMIYDSTVDDLIGQYQKMQANLSEEILRKQRRMRYLEEQTAKMKAAALNIGSFWYESIPEQLVCQNMKRIRSEYTINSGEKWLFSGWPDIMNFVDATMRVPITETLDEREADQETWYISLDSVYVSEKEKLLQSGFELWPEHISLCTVVDAGGRGSFSHDLFRPLVDHLKANGKKPLGEYMYGLMISRSSKNQSMQRLIRIEVPIIHEGG